ncbi:hypothetical protein N5U06_07875, partial [Aliarcobacter butzleri]|uniref:hypothetical protein n=1 Tax=Aliarcobacter butzleri TaxID=28197 RepID=UPI0021B1C12F
TIENQNQTIGNQNQTIENQNQTIENQNQTIENINDELISIYMSKSWKITRPLRSLIRKIKKGK